MVSGPNLRDPGGDGFGFGVEAWGKVLLSVGPKTLFCKSFLSAAGSACMPGYCTLWKDLEDAPADSCPNAGWHPSSRAKIAAANADRRGISLLPPSMNLLLIALIRTSGQRAATKVGNRPS